MDRHIHTIHRGRPVSSVDVAHANEYFEPFLSATSLKNILGYHRSICEHLHLKPNVFQHFYPKLKANLTSWKAKALWKKFDARASHKCYLKGKICANTKVLIIGAGPCGLRTAIEAQLLGAKVVVVEKRDRLSRNNVLHLWPFVIEDLRMLGAKKFLGKFCAGAIDHISIRQLQCILFKVALLLGVEIHTEVSFEKLIEPSATEKTGWRAEFKPSDHPVSQYEFDVIIGADGKRNTLQGFKRKEFRGKLAIAITANFINKKTEAEARVEEISGVAFIFNQKFFKDLQEQTRIDLENIVYYKDDTHYFVMTAKKASLLEKGVIKQDLADTEQLLAPDNVNRDALQQYAKEAADFSTNYQMPDLEFAVNHYGQPDVAMFDFTSMYAAEYASKVVERNGYRLLMILVGDSLLEPFWPTGSGCARGFLSSLDAAWAIRSWSLETSSPLEVLAERESIYRLLGQTTPDNLNKDWKSYTLDPATRYPNLNKTVVMPAQTVYLYDTDNPKIIEKLKRNSSDDLLSNVAKKRRRGNVDGEVLLNWVSEQVREHDDITITDMSSIFSSGKVLCAIIHRYRPDLLDYSAILNNDPNRNNQIAFDVLEREMGIVPVISAEEIPNLESHTVLLPYLTQIYDCFRGEIPHIKHPKLASSELQRPKSSMHPPPNPSQIPKLIKNALKKNDGKVKIQKRTSMTVSKLTNNGMVDKKPKLENKKEILKRQKSKRNIKDHEDNILKDSSRKRCKQTNNKNCLLNKSNVDRKPKQSKKEVFSEFIGAENETGQGFYPDFLSDKSSKSKVEQPKATTKMYTSTYVEKEKMISSETESVKIRIIERKSKNIFSIQCIGFKSSTNVLTISSKTPFSARTLSRKDKSVGCDLKNPICKCQLKLKPRKYDYKFLSLCNMTMCNNSNYDDDRLPIPVYNRVKSWITENDFNMQDEKQSNAEKDADLTDVNTDITSVSRNNNCTKGMYEDVKVEKRTQVVKCTDNGTPISSEENFSEIMKSITPNRFIKTLSKFSQYSPFQTVGNLRSVSAPPNQFPIIAEGEESAELPESNKRSEASFKSFKQYGAVSNTNTQPSRPSSRHKRHADAMTQNKPNSIDRKLRKRRTLEKVGATVDHDTKLHHHTRGNADEDFAARIKNMEDKWRDPQPVEKKPKDLLRAIGKIETSDWNIKEIEKKILENKLGKPVNRDKEKVPKWSKEQFLARQTKMERQHLDRQDSAEAKYADIDKSIKYLDMKLKEGTARELGQNKVASITEKLRRHIPEEAAQKLIEQTPIRPQFVLPTQSGAEFCHFCGKQVYHVEQLTAEGRYFHRGCFKCQYCNTHLRLGSYAFDRDGLYGYKFFCNHHYGMVGEIVNKVTKKESFRQARKSPEKKPLSGVAGVDLLDRVQTPERIEFSNLSAGSIISDHEESLSQMDEDEWTDKNFGASCTELGSSDNDSSCSSDTDSDDEDAFEEALEEPITKEGTLKWAERLRKRYSRKRPDSDSENYSSSDLSSGYENTSDEEESDTATEGEEEIRARELRKQEVRVEPPVVQTDTGTDTEIISDESSSESSSEILNSATEISTDSEFAQDDPTPTREIPAIVFNDFNVTKTRGTGSAPKKLQVTTGYLQKPLNGKALKKDIELKLKPLVPSAPVVKKPAPLLPRTENYALSRTQSTGGIAAKMSLELKKKYLLGEANHPGNIQKSGSASTLDTKFKSFVTNISDFQQKLFKPAQNIPLFKLSDPLISPQSPKNLIDTATAKDLPPPDVTNVSTTKQIIDSEPYEFENETEGRPRSPLHETSIIVPNINWDKKDDTQSDDSLSSGSFQALPNFSFNNIPRVEVHEAKDDENQDDIPPDSLCLEVVDKKSELETGIHSISSEPPKSISSERKMLNQPKSLPSLESVLPEIHKSLHIKYLKEKANNDSPENEVKENASERSSPDSCMEQATAALTETELSDWARDGAVSDDLEDFEFTREIESLRSHKRRKEVIPRENIDSSAADFDDMIHICGKEKYFIDEHNKAVLPVTATNILNANLDIDFMDTGTETSSDDGLVDSRNGYVLFKDEDELAEDSLNPTINDIFEAKNLHVGEKPDTYKNTGYCVLATEDNFGSQVVDLKFSDLEKLKQKQNLTDHEEDSLVIIETGTTTEENTCSDSTVKNLTELIAEKTQNNKYAMDNSNFQKQRLEEKLAKLKAEKALNKQNNSEKKGEHSHDKINVEFDEHCQRLQSKVEFSNVKDSIDIRKSRRKSRSETSQKPDLIQEEKERSSPLIIKKDITLNLAPSVRTPDILYKKEIIEKERDVNQKLIQEMVMNKMKAENKSLERKKRSRTTSAVLSSKQPYELSKSATTEINLSNLDKYNCKRDSSVSTTPDVLLTTNQIRLQKSQTLSMVPDINSSTEKSHTPKSPNKEKYYSRPLSIHSIFNDNNTAVNNSLQDKSPSTQTVKKTLFSEDFKTPVAPPRQKHEEAKKTAEKLKQDARARARLLSNEDLGLSPEEKLNRIREKISRVRGNENVDPHVQESIESLVKNTERRNSWLYSNDNQNKYRNNSFKRSNSTECESGTSKAKLSPFQYSNDNLVTPSRTKSISEFPKSFAIVKPQERESDARKMCKSDPNLLETDYKKSKKKNKDRESRKSITKLFSSLLSNGSKGIFSRISPKSKDISKEILVEEPVRRKSLSEVSLNNKIEDILPPPIPPLPLNYTGTSIKGTDESSDGENDHKNQDRSSCDTLDRSVNLEASMSSGRRASKSARRAARQAQVKRHRMAQEIQRKLEETEVKTRELESRGVLIEKALRGEDTEGANKDESELLQEWFDLMRDRTELQRYEKELVVRAQELELEDRHARLQHELRERLENDDKKTPDDVETEGSIIKEMMEIVAKRDSLIGLLEEARIRYSNEDRDFEEQMLAKGLRLTPIRKTTEK